MSDISFNYEGLQISVARFDGALAKLEQSLANAVNTVAELAHNTGFEDGKNAALKDLDQDRGDLILREELSAAKSREKDLENAIKEARSALTETIDDIKNVLGTV